MIELTHVELCVLRLLILVQQTFSMQTSQVGHIYIQALGRPGLGAPSAGCFEVKELSDFNVDMCKIAFARQQAKKYPSGDPIACKP